MSGVGARRLHRPAADPVTLRRVLDFQRPKMTVSTYSSARAADGDDAAALAPAAAPAPPPLVSVIMPCLDEAAGVVDCVRRSLAALALMGIPGEVVVADNGSTDGSAAAAAAAGARVVHEPRPGYGSALLRGFAEARGEILVMGDADGSYDFSGLPELIADLRSGAADLVMGSRFKGGIQPGAMPWANRWIGNPVLSGMLRLLFRTSVSDAHCGLRACTRSAYERMGLRTTGMEFASEMVIAALQSGLRISEVPILYHPRAGESKLHPVRDAWRHVRFMLLFSPSYLFQIPGLLLLLAGAIAVGLLAGGPRRLFGHTWDFHVLLFGAGAMFLGYSLMVFDLLAKTFSAGAGIGKPRPWLRDFLRRFTLERGLLVGMILLLAGLGLEIKIVFDWMRAGAGALMAVRGITVGMSLMAIGAQTLFASFLISLLLLERR